MKRMNRVLRWIFRPYEEDLVARYVHNGVGFAGIDYDLWNNSRPKIKHCGVGYTGVYDE